MPLSRRISSQAWIFIVGGTACWVAWFWESPGMTRWRASVLPKPVQFNHECLFENHFRKLTKVLTSNSTRPDEVKKNKFQFLIFAHCKVDMVFTRTSWPVMWFSNYLTCRDTFHLNNSCKMFSTRKNYSFSFFLFVVVIWTLFIELVFLWWRRP